MQTTTYIVGNDYAGENQKAEGIVGALEILLDDLHEELESLSSASLDVPAGVTNRYEDAADEVRGFIDTAERALDETDPSSTATYEFAYENERGNMVEFFARPQGGDAAEAAEVGTKFLVTAHWVRSDQYFSVEVPGSGAQGAVDTFRTYYPYTRARVFAVHSVELKWSADRGREVEVATETTNWE